MRKVHWLQLTTEEFKGLDPEKTIAVLPIAAIEQHGPHLAVSTDTIIGQGMVDAVIARLPEDLSALFLDHQSTKNRSHDVTGSSQRPSRTWGVMPRVGRDDRLALRRWCDHVQGCRSSPRIEP